MTWQAIASMVLLAVGVAIELLACLGVLVMDSLYDRLHYAGLASLLGPIAIAAAVLLVEAVSMAGIQVMLIAAALVVSGPIITHAMARTARVRQHGQWEPLPDEQIEEV
ncbi:MAG TPA: monovalent cation/H(+) antiporter subunit G [Ktedonobacterales bacterium]|nr:monovalent cation/H(+) antiporter subunit G [Ktedonobacterales bacterium]